MKYLILILFVLGGIHHSAGQDSDAQLAQYYYNQGELDKALPYYEKLYDLQPNDIHFKRYAECLRSAGESKDVLKLIKKQSSKNPRVYDYKVLLGKEYEANGDQSNANKVYENMLEDMQPMSSDVIKVSNAFRSLGKTELALQALEKGRKIIKGNYPLNYYFAEVYGELGQSDLMIEEYLGLLDYNASMLSSLKNSLPRRIDFEDENSKEYEILRIKLLEKIQKNPNETVYADLLIWTLVQRRKFESALIQAKALDKRTANDGREVIILGRICLNSRAYSPARKAFKYVVDLGSDSPYYYTAEQALLNTRYVQITQDKDYTQEDLTEAIAEYQIALDRLGNRSTAVPIIKELAQIQAFYAGKPEEAKKLLEDALSIPGIRKNTQAETKILLADVLVVLDDIWEASLLYMQVEKDFKFDPIGYEAKFKNARVFYYDGDFIWAQSQLNVLKESTTKLIANDAMKLSILITDNLGLDSNYTAMTQFAKADLFLAQHKYSEAFVEYDSIVKFFPFHGLADEILMRKAQAWQEQGKWEKAIPLLEKVYTEHAQDITADDAIFQLAKIYDDHLFDSEKAQEWYKKILFEYKGSLHVVESRERFRALKGGEM